MTTHRLSRRPRNARLLGHLLRVSPPPDSPEQWVADIETILEGPPFRRWDDADKAQFLTDARLALTALLSPRQQEEP